MRIAILGADGTGKTRLATALVNALPAGQTVLIADSTALMTAIRSDQLFGDTSLYDAALEQQRGFDLTLLTGLDLATAADGVPEHQHHAREAMDARLRQILNEHTMPYAVVYGTGPQRTASALQAIAHRRGSPLARSTGRQRSWQGACEKCSDPECEHRLFTGRLKIGRR